MRQTAENSAHNPPGPDSSSWIAWVRRLSAAPIVGAIIALATCVQTPAQEPAPRPMSALFAGTAASLPSLLSPSRAPGGDVPTAVPVVADPASTPAPPTLEEPEDQGPEDLDADPADDPPDDESPIDPLEIEPPTVAERLQEVFWTVPEDLSLEAVASKWGHKSGVLAELNPELTALDGALPAGTRLRVYKYDVEKPTLSMGSPNRGKLRNGMPLPEGPAWRLRVHRPRTYGAVHTINALVQAFEAWGSKYPDGPKLRIGEISRRTGGRVPPHSSHRSGRDIDIGYIFRGIDDGEHRWKYMNVRNFDAEKNWALVQALVETGQVQTIYISKKLQKLLHKEAQKHLDDAQLAALFEYPHTSESPHALIQHWRGHANHMHVRFKCEPGNRRCRARHRG
jgi:murein endopeptidase